MAAADGKLLKLISGGGRRATFLSLLRDLTKSAAPAESAKPKAAKVKAAKPAKSGKPHKAGKKAKKKAA
jgi:hypothetical protein